MSRTSRSKRRRAARRHYHKRRRTRARLIESLEPRLLLAGDWHNACLALDATHDGAVVPLDALVLINRLNAFGSGPLPPAGGSAGPPPYYDTTGDDRLTPVDVLVIVNALNGGRAAPEFDVLGLTHDTAPNGKSNADGITFDGRISGHVSAPLGLTSFTASVDGGAPIPVKSQCGDFLFDAGWATDGSDDGDHTIRFTAAYQARFRATKDVTFTLDTSAPPLSLKLDPNSDTPPAGDGKTDTNPVALVGTTEAKLDVTLQYPQRDASADDAGQFRFDNIPIVYGPQVFTAQAYDVAGNRTTVQTTVDYTCSFPPSGDLWTVHETGGSQAGAGGATFQQCHALLREGDSFRVEMQRQVTVPAEPSNLVIELADPAFDNTAPDAMADAVEIALVDASGQSLVHTIAKDRDALFNWSAGQPVRVGANTTFNAGTVTVDLSNLAAGTDATLIIRAVNNDGDLLSTTQVNRVAVVPRSDPSSPRGAPLLDPSYPVTEDLDLGVLDDVTQIVKPEYGTTSFDAATGMVYADVTLANVGSFLADAPVVVVVDTMSDPSVVPVHADGYTPDGRAYFEFSSLVAGGTLNPQDATSSRAIGFVNPHGVPFTYAAHVLAMRNHDPEITS